MTDQTRIFQRFEQLGVSLTGKPEGLGLGLSIARDTRRHGGDLRVTSEPGAGSDFGSTFPWRSPSRPAMCRRDPEQHDDERRNAAKRSLPGGVGELSRAPRDNGNLLAGILGQAELGLPTTRLTRKGRSKPS